MTAKTLSEVRSALKSSPSMPDFAQGFADAYFAQAFGVLPKAEIDLLVFRLLIETGVIDANGSVFAMARALNITPTKARGLLFQYQLRFVDTASADVMILRTLAAARYSVDDARLSFGIESPLVRAAIDARLKERGIFADMSLSGEILRVPLAQFDEFVSMLMTDERADALEKALKTDGHLKDKSLRAHLKKYAEAGLKGGAGAAGKSAFTELFGGLGRFLETGDGIPDLGSLLDSIG